ncbi:MAG: tol-pal system-associated acyl-CoA thioesterase [Rhodobacter sp.]|nr:tol-pal system-associated acyl-CoA thioesterase [Rhodobacter sp.]
MTHRFDLRVYYEDTDLAGIVYYANYLKFIERGRSEFVRALGIDQIALQRGRGLVFAVRRLEAEYLQPAHFDDQLCVETILQEMTGARIHLGQAVKRGESLLFSANITLVALTGAGAPARIPADIRQKLTGI